LHGPKIWNTSNIDAIAVNNSNEWLMRRQYARRKQATLSASYSLNAASSPGRTLTCGLGNSGIALES